MPDSQTIDNELQLLLEDAQETIPRLDKLYGMLPHLSEDDRYRERCEAAIQKLQPQLMEVINRIDWLQREGGGHLDDYMRSSLSMAKGKASGYVWKRLAFDFRES